MPACSAVRESAGAAQITTVLLGSAALLLVTWISTYAIPYGTFLRASCLVLNSTQTLLPKGFNREPLYRARPSRASRVASSYNNFLREF